MTTATLPPRAVPRSPWLTGVCADVLALAVLCAGLVPALAPLAAAGVPATHDGYLHIQRLVVLAQMARDGTPFSRWVPDLAYGYGQPLFNYYAPLAYGPALLAHVAGLDVAASFELATAGWLIGSAFAMYVLGRALFGPMAALTAALVYAYLPYQLVDVYVRGALAETAAFTWLPLVAWCLLMARLDGRARWSAGLAVCVAGLILTHNITAFIAAPAFAALWLVLWLGWPSVGRPVFAHRPSGDDESAANSPVIPSLRSGQALGVANDSIESAYDSRDDDTVNSPVILSAAKDLRTNSTSELLGWSVRRSFAALRMTMLKLWRGGVPRAGWWRPALGAAVGLLLAAWYWLPAVTERDLVQIGETIEPALFGSFFIRQWPPFNFGLSFDYAEPVSMALGSPVYWPRLGLVQLIVTVGGVLAIRRTRGPARPVLGWSAGLALATFLLQLGPAEALYRAVPLASFIQFPWRLLALLGLASALLAGGLVATLGRTRELGLLVGCVVVGASMGTAVGRLDPLPEYPDARYLTADGVFCSELADYALGTTHSGEYLPITSGVRNTARFRKELLEDPPGQAPAGPPVRFQIEGVEWQPGSISFRVAAPVPDRVLVHQFAFPGWSVRLDGLDAPLVTAGRFGLLAVDVPAGSTLVELRWGWTPIRLVGAALSVVGVIVLLLAGGWSPRRGRRVAMLSLGAAVAVAGYVYVQPGMATGAVAAQSWPPVDERLALVRADLDYSRVRRVGLVAVRLDWLALDRVPPGYSVTVQAEAANGATHRARWAYDGLVPRWERGELVPTTTTLRLPASFPSGEVRIAALVERSGVGPGEPPRRLDLGTVEVPVRAAGLASRPEQPVVAGLAPLDRHLVTASGHWHVVRPGDWIDADLTFAAAAGELADDDLYGVLVLHAGRQELASDARRIGDWFQPLPFWQAGDVWRQRIRLVTPSALAPGEYEATVRLYGRDLAPGGLAAPGASSWRPRGRPVATLELGTVTVAR